jgi:glycosyltransferase involved in cell wall biosynthesis
MTYTVKEKFKVAMVAACPFPANHGTPAAIRELSQTLAELGHEVHVVTYPLYEEGIEINSRVKLHRTGRERQGKIVVGPFWERFLFDLLLPFKLCATVKQEGLDVIHAHNYEGLLAGIWAKFWTGRPLIYNAINTMVDELPDYGFIKPRFLAVLVAKFLDRFPPRLANFVIADTPALRQFLITQGVKPEKIEFIPSGVDLNFFREANPRRVRETNKLGDRPLVIYTGTFDNFQGLDLLFSAFKEVKRHVSEAVLMLVGSTVRKKDLEKYEKMANDLDLSAAVIFTNADLQEIPDYLATADVAVVPKRWSPGIPTKLLNYLAAGRPVVSFEGSAHFLKGSGGAYIVSGDDWQALAKGIVKLLLDRELASEFACKGRKLIEQHYDWYNLCGKIAGIYKKITRP